jgi:hypothetical protein
VLAKNSNRMTFLRKLIGLFGTSVSQGSQPSSVSFGESLASQFVILTTTSGVYWFGMTPNHYLLRPLRFPWLVTVPLAHQFSSSVSPNICQAKLSETNISAQKSLYKATTMAPFSVLDQQYQTFSNDNFTCPLKYELDAMESEPTMRVTFRTDPTIMNPDAEYYTCHDILTKWFSSDELLQIKSRAKGFSTILRRSKRVEETCLTMAHRKTSLMLKSDYKALVKLSPSTPDQDLHQWCSHNDGRRGLERFSSRDYCCFRRKDVIATRTMVLEEQARQHCQGHFNEEMLANVSREASRRARSFALFFGEADSLEAREVGPAHRRAPPRKRSRTIEVSSAAAWYYKILLR